MKDKNLFLKSTIILIISGFFTKTLGFIIRIVYTRIIGDYGISLLTIATPTYSLLLTISTLALPIAISKLVAENKGRSIRILSTAAAIILTINFIIIIITIFTKDFIANTLLKEPLASPILLAFSLTLPFVSISSVLKGYFAGKQNMIPHATSNIIEQIIRLVLISTIIPILMQKSVMLAIVGLILLTIISEISSMVVFIFFLPKNIDYHTNLLPSKVITKKILDISIPSVSGRIIGNIGYFLEPIILTNILIYLGYPTTYILREYGAYNAYALSILTMPSFFIGAIATALLPEISKEYRNGHIPKVKNRIKQAFLFAFIIGFLFSLSIFIFRSNLLSILYNTDKGSDYIKVLAPFFVLYYLEGVLTASLQALGQAKKNMQISLYGVLLKLFIMSFLCFCHIGIYSLIIAEIINIIFVVLINFLVLKKLL